MCLTDKNHIIERHILPIKSNNLDLYVFQTVSYIVKPPFKVSLCFKQWFWTQNWVISEMVVMQYRLLLSSCKWAVNDRQTCNKEYFIIQFMGGSTLCHLKWMKYEFEWSLISKVIIWFRSSYVFKLTFNFEMKVCTPGAFLNLAYHIYTFSKCSYRQHYITTDCWLAASDILCIIPQFISVIPSFKTSHRQKFVKGNLISHYFQCYQHWFQRSNISPQTYRVQPSRTQNSIWIWKFDTNVELLYILSH